MGFQRYASFAVIASAIADEHGALPAAVIGEDPIAAPALFGGTLVRQAHRHVFAYKPRPGYLYVRSRAISSRCNDNYDEFPAEEIKKAYATFIGKPVFVNHHNDNHRRARGVIIDAALHEDTNPDGTPDTWAEVLMEVDAVRFPRLAEAVVKGHIDRTSMGTDVAYSVCTYCGNKASNPAEYCAHIPKMKGQRITRRTASGAQEAILVAERCYGLGFFENSLLVEQPADPTAYTFGVDTTGLAMDPSTAGLARAASLRSVVAEAESITREAMMCAKCNPNVGLFDGLLCSAHAHMLKQEVQHGHTWDALPEQGPRSDAVLFPSYSSLDDDDFADDFYEDPDATGEGVTQINGKEFCSYAACPGRPPGTHHAPDDYNDEYHDQCWDAYLKGSGVYVQQPPGFREARRWDDLAKVARVFVEAGEISRFLRKAGFEAAKSSSTRVRGAPRVSEGFTAQRYNPLETKDWVVKVSWNQGEWYEGRPAARDQREVMQAMAAALEAEGYEVTNRGSEIYVHGRAGTTAKVAELEPVEVAGLAIQAADTGRILMIQRSFADPDDPARGTWEFPGGHLDDGEHPPTAAIREFTEEVGCEPPHGDIVGSWRSGPIYQGFHMIIPTEADLNIHCGPDERAGNPDDPDGDDLESVAWWFPADAKKNPALRSEVKSGTDWSLFTPYVRKATAAWDALAKTAATYDYQVHLSCGDDVRYVGSQPNQVQAGQQWQCSQHGETKVADVAGPGTTDKGLGFDTYGSRREARDMGKTKSKIFDISDTAGQQAWISKLPKGVQGDVERIDAGDGKVMLWVGWGGEPFDPSMFKPVPEIDKYVPDSMWNRTEYVKIKDLKVGDLVVAPGFGYQAPHLDKARRVEQVDPSRGALLEGMTTWLKPTYPSRDFRGMSTQEDATISRFVPRFPSDPKFSALALTYGPGAHYSPGYGFDEAVAVAQENLAIQRQVARDPQGFVIHEIPDGAGYRVYDAHPQEPGGVLPPGERVGREVARVAPDGTVTRTAARTDADIMGPLADAQNALRDSGFQSGLKRDVSRVSGIPYADLSDMPYDQWATIRERYCGTNNRLLPQYQSSLRTVAHQILNVPHCQQCGSTNLYDLDTGDDPELQGYTRCCNERSVGRCTAYDCGTGHWSAEDNIMYSWDGRSLRDEQGRVVTSRHLAYGEQVAPTQVNTLREEACPVCGDKESFSGKNCLVCGYITPPEKFQDPDLSKARQVDLRGGDTGDTAGQTLVCPECGETFTSAGDAHATTTTGPATPEIKTMGAWERLSAGKPPWLDKKKKSDDEDEDKPAAKDDAKDGDKPQADKPEKGKNPFAKDDEDPAEGDDEDPSAADEQDPAQDDAQDPGQAPEEAVKPGDPCPNCGVGILEVESPEDPAADPTAQPEDQPDAQADDPAAEPGESPADDADGHKDDADEDPDDEDPDDAEEDDEEPEDKPGAKPKKKNKNPFAKQTSRHQAWDRLEGSAVEMTAPTRPNNAAKQERSRLLAALQRQQQTIETQALQIEALRQGLHTLAKAAGVDSHPHLAILKSASDDENAEPVATTTDEARKPDATDDVETVGGAPAPANVGVTPDAVTDVQNTNVALDAAPFNTLVDVTAPTPGTDAPDPNADAPIDVHAPNAAPNQNPFPNNSGWTAAKEDPQERLLASLRLARLRKAAGWEDGDEFAAGQIINDDKSLVLAAIKVESETLEKMVAKQASRPQVNRSLVPQRAEAVQRTVPSVTASAGAPGEGADTGVGSENFLFS